MRNLFVSIVLGLTATIALHTPLPVKAEAKIYEFVSGKESFRFNAEGLNALESLGLSFTSARSTAVPAPGYTAAFDLVPGSSDRSDRGSPFTFSYDDVTGEFIPLSGTVDFTGSLFFNVDTTKLALPPQLELGNLSAQPAIDLDVIDTISTGLPIFTLEPSAPTRVDLNNQTVTLNFDTFISQQFSDFLVAAGANTPIAGLRVGDVQGDRKIAEVPEPTSALAILIIGAAIPAVGFANAARKLRRNA